MQDKSIEELADEVLEETCDPSDAERKRIIAILRRCGVQYARRALQTQVSLLKPAEDDVILIRYPDNLPADVVRVLREGMGSVASITHRKVIALPHSHELSTVKIREFLSE